MLSSKSLAERNNDPAPNIDNATGRRVTSGHIVIPGCTLAPRPEFQHGKLEGNPILVMLRILRPANPGQSFRDLARFVLNPHSTWDRSNAEIAHARRVLTLWLAVFA